ncbi:hypothetical protein SRDD_07270 [Serratia sp. DD3]|nr:hypothetical protein SRDD_07270 [Serratia sp. DD3]
MIRFVEWCLRCKAPLAVVANNSRTNFLTIIIDIDNIARLATTTEFRLSIIGCTAVLDCAGDSTHVILGIRHIRLSWRRGINHDHNRIGRCAGITGRVNFTDRQAMVTIFQRFFNLIAPVTFIINDRRTNRLTIVTNNNDITRLPHTFQFRLGIIRGAATGQWAGNSTDVIDNAPNSRLGRGLCIDVKFPTATLLTLITHRVGFRNRDVVLSISHRCLWLERPTTIFIDGGLANHITVVIDSHCVTWLTTTGQDRTWIIRGITRFYFTDNVPRFVHDMLHTRDIRRCGINREVQRIRRRADITRRISLGDHHLVSAVTHCLIRGKCPVAIAINDHAANGTTVVIHGDDVTSDTCTT